MTTWSGGVVGRNGVRVEVPPLKRGEDPVFDCLRFACHTSGTFLAERVILTERRLTS